MYDPVMVQPMRDEVTRLGMTEMRTADVVVKELSAPGTAFVFINSVCGCAAGKARPGLMLALKHQTRPNRLASVFAGFDVEATERARAYFTGRLPSSPSIALLQGGKLVYMLERYQIENRSAEQISTELTAAFDRFCGVPIPS